MFNVPNNTKVRDYRRTAQQKTTRTRNARELRYYLQKSESESTIQTTTLQRFFFDERSHFVDFFFFLLFGKHFSGSLEINMNKMMVLLVFFIIFCLMRQG